MSRRVRRCLRLVPNRRHGALSCTQYATCSSLQQLAAACSVLQCLAACSLLSADASRSMAFGSRSSCTSLDLCTCAVCDKAAVHSHGALKTEADCTRDLTGEVLEQNSPPPDLCRGPPSEDGRVERMSRCLGGASPRPQLPMSPLRSALLCFLVSRRHWNSSSSAACRSPSA